MKYKIKITLRQNCVDEVGNFCPLEVLNSFQIAANYHGELLGVSFAEMLKKNLLWVVTRIYYEVCGDVEAGQEVEVTTWPLAPSRLGYEREYIITDLNGNILIKGTSNWAIISADTRRLVSFTDIYNDENLCAERVFDLRIKRIKNFEGIRTKDIIPDSTMIDCNNHVNNTYYAGFFEKSIGGFQKKLKTFQIDYHREVLCGQPINMYVSSTDLSASVKGENSDGDLMFCSFAEYF